MPTLAFPPTSETTSARPSKASPAPAGRTPAGPVRPPVCVRSADIDVLYDPRLPSKYHGVSFRSGVDRRASPWVACYGYRRTRPFVNAQPTHTGRKWVRPKTYHRCPREAAAHIVQFWRGRYGDAWPAVFRARACRPWEVVAARGRGYLLYAWVRGVRTAVFPAGTAYFRDKPSAAAYLRRWRVKEHGPNWRAVLWRQARG